MRCNSRGATLIEMIAYMAFFGVLMSGALVAAYDIREGSGADTMKAAREEEGTFILGKLDWLLSSATNVSTNSDGSILTVTRHTDDDFTSSDNPVVLDGSDNKYLKLSRGGRPFVYLGSASFKVRSFRAELDTNSSGIKVDVQFTLQPAATTSRSMSIPFTYSTYIR